MVVPNTSGQALTGLLSNLSCPLSEPTWMTENGELFDRLYVHEVFVEPSEQE